MIPPWGVPFGVQFVKCPLHPVILGVPLGVHTQDFFPFFWHKASPPVWKSDPFGLTRILMIGLNNARFQWLDLWPFLHSHYRNFIGSTTAFQQQFICLFSSSDSFLRKLLPFLVPIILSLHIPLGLHYEPVSLPVPVTQHGRSEGKFLLNHTDCALTHPYISIWSSFRPVHSRIRQFTRRGKHSNHRYFVDSWPISSTICFQTAFGHHKW